MNENKIERRTFLQRATLTTLSAVGLPKGWASPIQGVVPNSSGTEAPKLKAPPLAGDCHHHIYDVDRFPPVQPGAIPNARVSEYRMLQRRIGTRRDVIVTPRPYGTDNRVTVDAIAQLGANARGVAVVHPDITDSELKKLADGGIRGIRFLPSASATSAAVTTIDMIEPLSKRVNDLGWHVQIAMDGDQIVAAADLWNRLPSVIVFDHMGELPMPMGVKHPAFNVIRRLIDKGRAWVKVSVGTQAGEYVRAKGRSQGYAEVNQVGKAYVQAAAERLVWGSNWPHPNETTKPDDAVLLDLLAEWAPNEATRHRILVENPETLYGFSKSA